jgi:hypothetical protein
LSDGNERGETMSVRASLQRLLLLGTLFVLVATVSACSGCTADEAGGDPDCIDNDGDGFGTSCSAGPDCNDFNPEVITCDCTEGNFAGCECTEIGMTEDCFDGLPGQIGLGECKGGTRTCDAGAWTPCIGQTPPLEESCDSLDNDCDGELDEDLPINACGTCDPLCEADGAGVGNNNEWDIEGQGSDGLVENPEGGLELSSDSFDFTFLWIANSEEGTVSKIDTRTGQEVGRYVSALMLDLTMPFPLAPCDPNSDRPIGNCPSRTAVDLHGDVWVANRAFNSQGSVTKIAHRDCVDKNGNGTIETSNDANGNGTIELLDNQEFFGEDDECILFTKKIGIGQSVPRALAIDPFAPVRGVGSVWVGAFSESRYYQLDAATGDLIRTVDVPHNPYGCIIDRFGSLWSIDLGSTNISYGPPRGLVKIVSRTGEVSGPIQVRGSNGCSGGYGVTLDGADNIWIGAFACESVHRYTPSTDSWFTVKLPSGTGYARGVAADRDGWIYVGSSHTLDGDLLGHITRFRHEDGSQLNTFDFGRDSQGTIGVGLDYEGRVWGVNQATSSAVRLDPTTGETVHFPTGTGPYTYSDFTGYTLRNFTAPQGTYREVFSGCEGSSVAVWKELRWSASTPVGTTVSARVKSSLTMDGLVTAESHGPYEESPADISAVPPGKFLEVEMILATDTPGVTPVLWGFEAVWTCPPVQ